MQRFALLLAAAFWSAISWATDYTMSNANGSALRWDGGYNWTSGAISFTLSTPSSIHATGDFPTSGYVELTCISIGGRKDGGSSNLHHVVLTAANGRSYTSSRVEVLDGSEDAANIFTTTLASGGNYGAAGSYGQGGGQKTFNVYFDSAYVDVASALTLATYTSESATGNLGTSVVASTSTGTDWKATMRIYGKSVEAIPVARSIAADADVNWTDAAWTVNGTDDQSFTPGAEGQYDVTVTVGGDCEIAMPSSIGSFDVCDVAFELAQDVESANVTLKYSGTLPSDPTTSVALAPFGAASVTAGTGVTLTLVYNGDTTGYLTQASGVVLTAAKRPSVGVVSVRIGARTPSPDGGYINPSYNSVGPYPMSGVFWNQTKFWNNNSTSGNYTDIQNLTDAKDGSSSVRIGYYGHNTYFNDNGNDASTPNQVLTKTYLDDSDSGNGDLTATASAGGETINLPTPGHVRGWQLHFENIPYNAYDVYFITASDVTSGLKECPIYVSLDGGTTWKSYVGDSVNQKTVMGTEPWTGLHYAVGGNLVHGQNYIKMRITKSIYGDNIGTIDITHGTRNTGSKIRSGLAAIQIVEVENDGVYTLEESGDWSDAIWATSANAHQTWTDTVEGEASIAKIASSETVASVTVDEAVSAGSVILTGSDPFTVAGSSTLTVETGFDASAFTGSLNLQAPIDGTVYIGSGAALQFGGDSDMTLPAYTLDGAGAWTKVGTGKLTVGNGVALAGTVNAGSVEFTSSTSGNISLVGGDLRLAGGESELVYSGTATLAPNGTGKTVIVSGTVQSAGNLSTDIDVEDGAVLKLGAAAGFGSTGAAPSGKTITVKSGGVIELNGQDECNAYTLAGGTLRNTGASLSTNKRQTMGLTLTADSTVQAGSQFCLVNANHAPLSVALGGNVLTKTGSANFLVSNATVTGTAGSGISVTDGTLQFVHTASTVNVPVSVAASKSVQLDVATEIASVSGAGTVSGSAALTTSGIDLSTGLTVSTPVALKNGATVTLGSGSITGAITVPDNASVTVSGGDGVLLGATTLGSGLTLGANASLTIDWGSGKTVTITVPSSSAGTLTIGTDGTVTASGALAGSGTVAVASGASLTLAATSASSVAIASGGTLTVSGEGVTLSGAVVNNGTLSIGEGATVSGALSGSGSLAGAGTLVVSSNDVYQGMSRTGLDDSSAWTGTVRLHEFSPASYGTPAWSDYVTDGIVQDYPYSVGSLGNASSTIELSGLTGGYLNIGKTVIVSTLKITGTNVLNNGFSVGDSGDTYQYGGRLFVSGAVTGSGTLSLNGNQSDRFLFSGSLAGFSGTLSVVNGDDTSKRVVLGSSDESQIGEAGEIVVAGNCTAGGWLEAPSGLVLKSGTLALTVGEAKSLAASIASGATLAKSGSGTLSLDATGSAGGGLTVSAGAVTLSGTAPSLGTVTVASGATLTTAPGSGNTATVSALAGLGALEVGNGTLAITGASTRDARAKTTIASGATLDVSASGASLYAATFGGEMGEATVTVRGTLHVRTWAYSESSGGASLGALRTNAYAVALDGGTVRLSGATPGSRGFTVTENGGTVTVDEGVVFTQTGNESLYVAVDAGGTLTLAGAGKVAISQSTAIAGGLAVSSGTTLSGSVTVGSLTFADGATLDATAGTVTVSGAVIQTAETSLTVQLAGSFVPTVAGSKVIAASSHGLETGTVLQATVKAGSTTLDNAVLVAKDDGLYVVKPTVPEVPVPGGSGVTEEQATALAETLAKAAAAAGVAGITSYKNVENATDNFSADRAILFPELLAVSAAGEASTAKPRFGIQAMTAVSLVEESTPVHYIVVAAKAVNLADGATVVLNDTAADEPYEALDSAGITALGLTDSQRTTLGVGEENVFLFQVPLGGASHAFTVTATK